MRKKILLGLVAIVAVAGGVAAMSAFEAHVINVTAKIENALAVSAEPIDFGTVFPQEYFEEEICIELSQSFLDEDRVDDVVYEIKQKPKPKSVMPDGLPILKPDINMYMDGGQFAALYPHWIEGDALRTNYCHTMAPENADDPNDSYYINCYPVLCPYLSKHKSVDDNDRPTDQPPFDTEVDAPDADWAANVADGYLTKLGADIEDLWAIDLVVPCFEGMCAQDWQYQGFELPADLESAVFGCDLWIEVTNISEECIGCY